MKNVFISLEFLSDIFQKQCLYLHDCRVEAGVWNNTHTDQPALFTAGTELQDEQYYHRWSILALPKTPSLCYSCFYSVQAVYYPNHSEHTQYHDNRWKFINNRYKLLYFFLSYVILLTVYIFLSQIQGQIKKEKKKKNKNRTVTQILYLTVSVWHLELRSAAGTVTLLIVISFRGWAILTILTQVWYFCQKLPTMSVLSKLLNARNVFRVLKK